MCKIEIVIIDNHTERANALKSVLSTSINANSISLLEGEDKGLLLKDSIEPLQGWVRSKQLQGAKIPWLLAHDRNIRGTSFDIFFNNVLTYSADGDDIHVLKLVNGNERSAKYWEEFLYGQEDI